MLPVSTCSLCASNLLLGVYLQADWSNTIVGEVDYSKFYSCKHVNAVISWVSHKAIPSIRLPPESSPTYQDDVALLFTELLLNPPVDPVQTGNWILTNVHYPFKAGRLMFYLSEHEGVFTFCKTKSTSGRSYLFCFMCPRSRSCTHISMPPPLDVEDSSTSPNRPAPTIANAVTEIEDSLISKERYSFDLDNDEQLREVIRQRTFTPILNWVEENNHDGFFMAEQRTCCDTPCQYFSTSAKQVELFSLHGYSLVRPILASKCSLCERRYDFDGRSLGILNYGNRYLFTVELILDLLEFKAISGTPTYSYWHARSNTMLKPWTTQETADLKKKWMSMAGRVNGIMTAFLALIDYPENHFNCCEDPEVVCIDGIVLSVESRRIQNDTPWVDPAPIRGRFSKKEDRYLVALKPPQKERLKIFIRSGLHIEDLLNLCAELEDPFDQFISQNCLPDQSNQ